MSEASSAEKDAGPVDVLFGPRPPESVKPTEAYMVRLLDQRYNRVSMGADRYVRAPQVRDKPGWASRICDYMAIDAYQSNDGDWSVRHALHGHEIKVSRGDWLTELRDPSKAEAFRPYCTHWWLVVSDASIVRDDLPDGWGLLVAQGSRLVARRKVPGVEPLPMPRPMLAGFLRSAATHAARLTREAFAETCVLPPAGSDS